MYLSFSFLVGFLGFSFVFGVWQASTKDFGGFSGDFIPFLVTFGVGVAINGCSNLLRKEIMKRTRERGIKRLVVRLF